MDELKKDAVMFADIVRPTEDESIRRVMIKMMLKSSAEKVTEQALSMVQRERELMESGVEGVDAVMILATEFYMSLEAVVCRLNDVSAMLLTEEL